MNAAESTSSTISLPPDFAQATPAYRTRVWFALLGLLGFLIVYIALASWFTYTAYRMTLGVMAGGDGAVASFFALIPATFLAVFMWKALFFVRSGSLDGCIEITRYDQPRLFDFLYELADEVGAPRPHKVFVSPDVNASVFYDLSVLNFFFSSKKNLLIGLGLVNRLNQSEFRAVLAHEYGHFTQRSMAVGRWVYVGEQVAGHIIAKRDMLDNALMVISSVDIRVAWIGWIMRTIVWSIRSLMETLFRWVIVAQRALGREMEFHADLVSVSACGSDALVNGLYRLQPADDDWARTLNFAQSQLGKGHQIRDLFAIQTRYGQIMQEVLNEPQHGKLPPPDTSIPPEQRRIFTEEIAQPPKMWATHPPNTEREENAKKWYIPVDIDETSAWSLFTNPEQLRETVTSKMFENIKLEKPPEPIDSDRAFEELEKEFDYERFHPDYQGAYFHRRITLSTTAPTQLIAESPGTEDLTDQLKRLYPESLQDLLTESRNLDEEIAQLEAIEAGYADASGDVIRHRGEVVNRRHLPTLIEEVKEERDAILSVLEEHEKICRQTHLAIAESLSPEWKRYLASLFHLLHYAEHSEADLSDAQGYLSNITAISTAAGRVSSRKLKRIIKAANELQSVLAEKDAQRPQVIYPEASRELFEGKSWEDYVEKLELPPANEYNISQWMEVVYGWSQSYIFHFARLRRSTVDELLKTERMLREAYTEGRELPAAPAPVKSPPQYSQRPRGKERPRVTRLDWWSRFTLAEGTVPAILRFTVASCIVGAVVFAGLMIGNATIHIYNGLDRPARVTINQRRVTVYPHQHKELSLGTQSKFKITTETEDGREIEQFEPVNPEAFSTYVYNIAGSAFLVKWPQHYGTSPPRPPEMLGTPRWLQTTVDHVFEEPPRSIDSSGSGGRRWVLSAESQSHPFQLTGLITDETAQQNLVASHARWDASDSRYILIWVQLASHLPFIDELLNARLEDNPTDIPALRQQQDFARENGDDQLLQRHIELAAQSPENPDWQYLSIRAEPDSPEQDQSYIELFERWPDHRWIVWAAAYAYELRGEWERASELYEQLMTRKDPAYDSSCMQLARLHRVMAGSEPPNLSHLKNSFMVNYQLMLETGQEMQGTAGYAYKLIADGELQQAFDISRNTPYSEGILILIASSKNSKPEWIEEALQLPVESIQYPQELLYLAALAVRSGKDPARYLAQYAIVFAQESSPTIAERLKSLLDSDSPDFTDSVLWNRLSVYQQGLLKAALLIAYPDKAPEDWKHFVQAALFGSERPAF